jgi:hypothetical protein
LIRNEVEGKEMKRNAPGAQVEVESDHVGLW